MTRYRPPSTDQPFPRALAASSGLGGGLVPARLAMRSSTPTWRATTVRDFDACQQCGQRAVSGSRHVTLIRICRSGPRRPGWCGTSVSGAAATVAARGVQHSDIAPRAVLTERACPRRAAGSVSLAGRLRRSPASSWSAGRR
jgi:hypothetical protein